MPNPIITVASIDPGKDGGAAVVTYCGHDVLSAAVCVVPLRPWGKCRDVVAGGELLSWLVARLGAMQETHGSHPALGVIEYVSSRPEDGGATGFAFGLNTGVAFGVLTAALPEVHQVTPPVWQRAVLGACTGGDKGPAKAYAAALLPGVDLRRTPRCRGPHSGVADAVCIGRWAVVGELPGGARRSRA